MKEKTFDLGSYRLHIIPTDQFKTVHVRILCKRLIKKEEITVRNLLSNILLHSTKLYPTTRLMAIETEQLYNLGLSSNCFLSGNYAVMNFYGRFLNETYTEEGMLEKSLRFIFQVLLNPNVKNNAFDNEQFRIAKNDLKEQIESIKDSPASYSSIRMLEEMDKKAPFSYRAVGYLEDLENITENSLYEYYQSVLKSDLIDIFVLGNVDVTQIKKIVAEFFTIKTLKKPGIRHEIEHKKIRKTIKVVKEAMDINQSHLLIGCKVDRATDFEKKYVRYLYRYLLSGGMDSKLFQEVREKNSLCYEISASTNSVDALFSIYAGIDKNNYQKALRLIKKCLKSMEKGEFSEEEIEKGKLFYISGQEEMMDSPSSIIQTFVSHAYLGTDLIDERKSEILKVNKNMITTYAKKIHIDTVYFMEGSKQNEENTIDEA